MSRVALLATLLLAGPLAQAQSFCSSDGQPRPAALLERFINADCEACWADAATPRPRKGELAIDWIVPGAKGEAAPLSAAANRDALARLAATGEPAPAQASATRRQLLQPAGKLRVAHGLPFNRYLGTSIELRGAGAGPWTAWLALVETLPAGAEGSPVERNLVRNVLQPAWEGRGQLSKQEQKRLLESRSMAIPEGAKAERLRLVGWVQDERGRIRAIAQSKCAPQGAGS